MRRRTLFLCLTWAVGLLLVCLLLYVGFGWLVSRKQPWLERLAGRERFYRWYQSYAKTAATLLPGDRDGDGVCDGLELFLGTDPGNASSCPRMYLILDHGGFEIFPRAEMKELPLPNELVSFDGSLLRPGERREVHSQIIIGGAVDVATFPSSFRLRLTPPAGIALATVGGPFVTGPLVVPVARDGSIDFEIQASTESRSGKRYPGNISMANAATGTILFSTPIQIGGTEGALAATVDEVRKENPLYAQFSFREPEKMRFLRLQWTTISPGTPWILVEAARDTPDAKWYPIYLCSGRQTSCLLAQRRVANRFNDYTGPLRFRIVPFPLSAPKNGGAGM